MSNNGAISPTSYKVKTSMVPTAAQEPAGGGNVIWIILFILALLVIAGLIVWLVLANRHKENNRQITLNGANVEVTSPTSITAVWAQTSSTEDIGVLYATLEPPIFGANGAIINANAFSSGKVSNGGTSAPVSKLQAGLKYYATLVITNPHTANYAVYTQLVYMQHEAVSGIEFSIQDILQVGRLEHGEITDDQAEVTFNQKPTDEDTILELTTEGKLRFVNTNPEICLFNKGDTSTGVLASKECSTVTNETGTWTYNHDGLANRWCLTSTQNNTNPLCMVLGPINPQSQKGTVNVSDQSVAGNAWANVTEE